MDWINSVLQNPDIVDFYLEKHIFCKSLHKILNNYKSDLENATLFVRDNAYYQTKKIKDNYERLCNENSIR